MVDGNKSGNGLPKHVAIIMDGNGRWAAKRQRPRIYGHRRGAMHARDFIDFFYRYEIPYLTLYAFSTENWSRPKAEVEGIIMLLSENLDSALKMAQSRNICIRHLGNMDKLPAEIQRKASEAIRLTCDNTGLTVNIAFNYGGRQEIVNAARRIIADRLPIADLDEGTFARYLDTAGMPDPDLFIRTGGEMRISNLLLWQSAYAELYFTETLWPDFDEKEFRKSLEAFAGRERRFGGL
jgi:undecaprenyl diphosphate synthase